MIYNSSFLDKLKALDGIDDRAALDLLYGEINKYLMDSKWTDVDSETDILLGLDYSLNVLGGYLTVTNRFKKDMPNRVKIYHACLEKAVKYYNGDKYKAIQFLQGLE